MFLHIKAQPLVYSATLGWKLSSLCWTYDKFVDLRVRKETRRVAISEVSATAGINGIVISAASLA